MNKDDVINLIRQRGQEGTDAEVIDYLLVLANQPHPLYYVRQTCQQMSNALADQYARGLAGFQS